MRLFTVEILQIFSVYDVSLSIRTVISVVWLTLLQ